MTDDDKIRARAHAIWEAEGRPEGKATEHWEQARADVAADKLTGKPAAKPKAAPKAKSAPSAAAAKPKPAPKTKAPKA